MKSGDSSIDEHFVKDSRFKMQFDATNMLHQVHGSCGNGHSVNVFIIGYSFLLLIAMITLSHLTLSKIYNSLVVHSIGLLLL